MTREEQKYLKEVSKNLEMTIKKREVLSEEFCNRIFVCRDLKLITG